jgi:hypothetical protein
LASQLVDLLGRSPSVAVTVIGVQETMDAAKK